jgi:hypothetical protein
MKLKWVGRTQAMFAVPIHLCLWPARLSDLGLILTATRGIACRLGHSALQGVERTCLSGIG